MAVALYDVVDLVRISGKLCVRSQFPATWKRHSFDTTLRSTHISASVLQRCDAPVHSIKQVGRAFTAESFLYNSSSTAILSALLEISLTSSASDMGQLGKTVLTRRATTCAQAFGSTFSCVALHTQSTSIIFTFEGPLDMSKAPRTVRIRPYP